MRYPAAEKAESEEGRKTIRWIVFPTNRLVERPHRPARRTRETLGIARATFYRLYQSGGPEALGERSSRPGRVWNRLPEEIREQIVALALEEPELSPRELAVRSGLLPVSRTAGQGSIARCSNSIGLR